MDRGTACTRRAPPGGYSRVGVGVGVGVGFKLFGFVERLHVDRVQSLEVLRLDTVTSFVGFEDLHLHVRAKRKVLVVCCRLEGHFDLCLLHRRRAARGLPLAGFGSVASRRLLQRRAQ